MKVLVKSERVPIVLMLIGSAFIIASSLSSVIRNEDVLLPLGCIIGILGFILWLIPTMQKFMRRSRKRSAKTKPRIEEEERPRRYARPRR